MTRFLFGVVDALDLKPFMCSLRRCVQPGHDAHFLGAVGTDLSSGPPHRSRRAELPLRAPTLGVWRRNASLGRDALLWALVSNF